MKDTPIGVILSAGKGSRLDPFNTHSHDTSRPVYALIRPITPVSVLSAIRRPSFTGRPDRIASIKYRCSNICGSPPRPL